VDPGTTDTAGAVPRRLRGWSSSRLRVSATDEPLIRDLRPGAHRPADRWRTGTRRRPARGRSPSHRAAPLQLDMFGSKSIFDFAELSQGYDPDRSRPRLAAWSDAGGGQATKGTGWMPWRQEPMKDVAGCVKLRGVASRRRSGDVRMGKPGWGNAQSPLVESNRPGGGKPAN
jgi:hypothetical protein